MNKNIEKIKAEENFKNLLNDDVKIRLEAAKYFSWLARNEFSFYRKEIFDNPKTYEKLLPLLNDNEPKIVCQIIHALGCAYERYRKDKKIETEFIKLFHSKNNEIINTVSIWARDIENNEKYKYVINLFKKAKSKKLISALCNYFDYNTENNMKNEVQNILLNKLETIKNEYSIKVIMGTLIRIRNKENINKLRECIEIQSEDFKEMVKWQIKINVPESEKKKVEKDLNIK